MPKNLKFVFFMVTLGNFTRKPSNYLALAVTFLFGHYEKKHRITPTFKEN